MVSLLILLVLAIGCTPINTANLYQRVMKHLTKAFHKTTTVSFTLPADYDDTPVTDMEWAYIPSGEFIMGSSDLDIERADDENPQHRIYLDPFWISKTEVTNAMYNACVSAGVCTYSVSHKTNPHFLDPAYANHPVVYINWKGAQTFCNWIGGRLPTEAEWEKAARGVNGSEYPWGADYPSILFNNSNNLIGDTTPVKAFPNGRSIYGVWDMGGNVREWVSDWYDANYYKNSPYNNPQGPEKNDLKVLKGASYLDSYRYSRSANRLTHKPNSPGAVRGFRCASSDRIHL